MAYATLMERLNKTTPAKSTPKDMLQVDVVEAQVESALKAISLDVKDRYIFQTWGALRQATGVFPLVTDIRRFGHRDLAVEKAAKSFEDGVVKMYELGAVELAEYYLRRYGLFH